MKVSCEIIRDLLPSYINDLCSEESKDLINEHVRECENCNEVLTKLEIESKNQNLKERITEKSSVKLFKRVRNRMLLKSVLFIVIAAALISNFYFVGEISKTISPEVESIRKDVEKRIGSEAEIIETTLSRTEMFVLFKDKGDGDIGMIYYTQHPWMKNRYLFLGGTYNTKGVSNQKYGIHHFSQGVYNGADTLIVVFGDNKGINAEKLELHFGNNILLEDISQKGYFISIYRFWEPGSGSCSVIFRDNHNNDITDKFYK